MPQHRRRDVLLDLGPFRDPVQDSPQLLGMEINPFIMFEIELKKGYGPSGKRNLPGLTILHPEDPIWKIKKYRLEGEEFLHSQAGIKEANDGQAFQFSPTG